MCIRYFAGAIHRHLPKLHGSRSLHMEMMRTGDLIVSFPIMFNPAALKAHLPFGISIKQPKRHIDAFYLMDMISVFESIWQKFFTFVVFF